MKTAQLSILKRLDNLVAGARSRAAAAVIGVGNSASTGPGGVVPSDLTGTTSTPTTIVGMDLTRKGSGLFVVNFLINYTIPAADVVSWDVLVVPDVTAFSGGTLIPNNLRYETTGSPVVVTGGTPVLQFGAARSVATGDIAHVPENVSGLVLLAAGRSVIQLNMVTQGDEHVTGMNVSGSAYELA